MRRAPPADALIDAANAAGAPPATSQAVACEQPNAGRSGFSWTKSPSTTQAAAAIPITRRPHLTTRPNFATRSCLCTPRPGSVFQLVLPLRLCSPWRSFALPANSKEQAGSLAGEIFSADPDLIASASVRSFRARASILQPDACRKYSSAWPKDSIVVVKASVKAKEPSIATSHHL